MKDRVTSASAVSATVLLSALLLIAVALPTAGASGSTSGDCGQDTALTLIEENPKLDPFPPPFVVGQVLCGEFLGPGAEAMIVPIVPATCGGYAGWAAFRRADDRSWQLAWNYRSGQTNLVATGNDLEETVNILGPGDVRCAGVKSTRTRTWHWDGEKFVSGPWTVHLKSGLSAFLADGRGFALPCLIGDSAESSVQGASCKSGRVVGRRVLTQKAELRPSGRVRVCRKYGTRSCGGAPCGCDEDFIKVLVGEAVLAGRFICEVKRYGVRCTTATGEGFFMNQNRVRRLS